VAKVSEKERVSHVVRRLSMGPNPDLVAKLQSPDEAIAATLDLTAPAPSPLNFPAPTDYQAAKNVRAIATPIAWWFDQMRTNPRHIEERLVWFWHDHFATSVQKVKVPYLMWQQHLTIRQHATGSFADLVRAMSKDPAMLVWLDGVTNTVKQSNENFGREAMELFTVGRDGGYTQQDVVQASHAFTGWVVNIPGRGGQKAAAAVAGVPPWTAAILPQRHDAGPKTLLGQTGNFDMDGALQVLLDHPSTARFVSTKLYRELVGLEPDEATVDHLATTFRSDYAILPLVQAIVSHPKFTSDDAVRAKVRTPVEKLVGLLQAVPSASLQLGQIPKRPNPKAPAAVGEALRSLGYIPFVPPNVGGFPKGNSLLGPHQLVHTFDLLAAVGAAPPESADADTLLARLGLFDVSKQSRSIVNGERDPARRFALAAASPEYALV
jgi:uncharacterized protein (DUF1800 family)